MPTLIPEHTQAQAEEIDVNQFVEEMEDLCGYCRSYIGICAEGHRKPTSINCKQFEPGCGANQTPAFLKRFEKKFCTSCDIYNKTSSDGYPECRTYPCEAQCLEHSAKAKEMQTSMQRPKHKQSVKTKCLKSLICPKCGKIGNLKRRTMAPRRSKKTGKMHDFKYLQVDHFKDPKAHAKSGYAYSCYLGKYSPELEAKIRAGTFKVSA